ncbi:hypothetical protein MSAN_01806600 [Mycena sanguinolenta]|uniref:Uncharacterized protein n=1 Tax=Mycena sanguinolenta TaxID=230812 RepID=A0A8H6XSI0_9AGAR|nr:hypothetical protein MSAN_01806600 [Mycena sanguinolenta]
MFSKLLAFGLGALAVVRAAPAFSFQTQQLSCSVNLDVSVAPVHSFNALEPGQYRIWNEAFTSGPLYATHPNSPVLLSPGNPGPTTIWSIAPSGNPGSNEYTITNTASNVGTRVTSGLVFSTAGRGESFTISPAGEGTFTIQVPNKDEVWTVRIPGNEMLPVFLLPEEGGIESRWRFVRVD